MVVPNAAARCASYTDQGVRFGRGQRGACLKTPWSHANRAAIGLPVGADDLSWQHSIPPTQASA
jgi:hypothetical protein